MKNPGSVSNRRQFLKIGAGVAGTIAMSSSISKAMAASCGLTPAQTPGPFFPGEGEFHLDNDLTTLPGALRQAEGQLIYVLGKILDERCNPIAGATVEIWQACKSGRYNNPNDTNPAALDPDFKYWGEASTNAQGEYSFKTIKPGAYPADTNWVRPPHIHFKVSRLGYHDLITQMYFQGETLNEQDAIFEAIPVAQRASVIVDFEPLVGQPNVLQGRFDITLKSVRG
jgi:protocatechuate 3,4-dioxygenase beta subunit